MISVEIRIAGSLVAVINGVNRGSTGNVRDHRGPECTYEWTAADFPMHLSGPPAAKAGVLKHWRGDGCVELARAMCAAYVKSPAETEPACLICGKPWNSGHTAQERKDCDAAL